jgi:hypothetical protein
MAETLCEWFKTLDGISGGLGVFILSFFIFKFIFASQSHYKSRQMRNGPPPPDTNRPDPPPPPPPPPKWARK